MPAMCSSRRVKHEQLELVQLVRGRYGMLHFGDIRRRTKLNKLISSDICNGC